MKFVSKQVFSTRVCIYIIHMKYRYCRLDLGSRCSKTSQFKYPNIFIHKMYWFKIVGLPVTVHVRKFRSIMSKNQGNKLKPFTCTYGWNQVNITYVCNKLDSVQDFVLKLMVPAAPHSIRMSYLYCKRTWF